jgi:hypothetical protein
VVSGHGAHPVELLLLAAQVLPHAPHPQADAGPAAAHGERVVKYEVKCWNEGVINEKPLLLLMLPGLAVHPRRGLPVPALHVRAG